MSVGSAGIDDGTLGSGPVRVELLTRPGCHLCGPVREIVTEVCGGAGVVFREVDVTADAELFAEYGEQIPVVLVDGEQLSAYTLEREELTAALAAA